MHQYLESCRSHYLCGDIDWSEVWGRLFNHFQDQWLSWPTERQSEILDWLENRHDRSLARQYAPDTLYDV